MIVGSTISHDGTGTSPYYTSSFARGGEAATFALDVTQEGGTPNMTVKVEHKNYADTSYTTAGTFTAITATGVNTLDVTGLKEEIRLSFEFASGSLGDFFHVVMAAPAWRQYA